METIKIEKKWQKIWEENKFFEAKNNSDKEKYYILVEFPYPSGSGLHVGHVRSYSALDAMARMKRLQGYNVLFPMGWDAFGAPAEQYAIKNHIYPADAVKENIKTFKSQIKSLGLSFDWSREFSTTDPEYYKWTQWQFLQFVKKDMAYKGLKEINWCNNCKTGLSNEDASGGVCERCGSQVTKKLKSQWILKMSDYAEKLLDGLKDTEFEEKIKIAQINWIGKSTGAEVDFKLKDTSDTLKIFTTRCDTLFGVTFMVMSPEHAFLEKYKDRIKNIEEVTKYQNAAKEKSEIERTDATKEKTGVKLDGLTAINPVNNKEIPIYISDYVLANYGTGAIMAVPAHDDRDYAFAKKFNIKIDQVIAKSFNWSDKYALHSDKETINIDVVNVIVKHPTEDKYLYLKNNKFSWNMLISGEIKEGETIAEAGIREIKEETGYNDIEIIKEMEFISFDNFYLLQKDANIRSTNHTVIGKLNSLEQEEKVNEIMWIEKDKLIDTLTTEAHKYDAERLIYGEQALTCDGVLVNSNFLDNLNKENAIKKMLEFLTKEKIGQEKINYRLQDWIFSRQRFWGEPIPMINCPKCGWVPVPENELPVLLPTVAHYEPTDTGESPLANITDWVNTKCPSCGGPAERETDTMPNWAGSSWYWLRYMDAHNTNEFVGLDALNYWGMVDYYNGGMEHATRHLLYARFWHQFLYEEGLVPTKEPFKKRVAHGMILGSNGEKMSKSKGNVINPDDMVKIYGADALRTYELFIGDYEKDATWSDNGLKGCKRFLDKVERLKNKVIENLEYSKDLENIIHKTIKKVTTDLSSMKYNTAVSSLMILSNAYEEKDNITKKDYQTLLILLNPIAPHLTEELNETLGETKKIAEMTWPTYDEAKTIDNEITIGVQVNGKLRGEITIQASDNEEIIKEKAITNENVQKHLTAKEIVKVIVIKGKIVNIVVK